MYLYLRVHTRTIQYFVPKRPAPCLYTDLDAEVGPLGALGHGGTALGGGLALLVDGLLAHVANVAVVADEDLTRATFHVKTQYLSV